MYKLLFVTNVVKKNQMCYKNIRNCGDMGRKRRLIRYYASSCRVASALSCFVPMVLSDASRVE